MESSELNGKHFRISDYILIVLIYISVFVNSYIFFKSPFEFYLGYLIYVVLMPFFVFRYGFNRELIGLFFVLLIVGVANILLGNNTTQLFLKVFTGLFLSYMFYYYIIVEFKFNVEQLFKWYLTGSYYVAWIGIIQFVSFHAGFYRGYDYTWILNKWALVPGGNFGIRVNSIFAEPTHLGACLSASFFIATYNMISKEKYHYTRFQSVVIILVYVLSFSGLGQTGIFLTLLFLLINFGLLRYILVVVPAGIFLFNVMYNNVEEFRDRLDGLIHLYTTGEFILGKTHGSSFILYNNAHVAIENFKSNFMFGSGIGSHPIAFDRYTLAGHIKVGGININSADANSMLLRLISETGLFGVTIFVLLIFKCFVLRDDRVSSSYWLISNSILVMILLNLFRQGHYFLNGFPLFVLLYFYNKQNYNQAVIEAQHESTAAEPNVAIQRPG